MGNCCSEDNALDATTESQAGARRWSNMYGGLLANEAAATSISLAEMMKEEGENKSPPRPPPPTSPPPPLILKSSLSREHLEAIIE